MINSHPNICRYFCHFQDISLPREFYNHISTPLKEELASYPQRNKFDCVVREHHSDTLGKLLKTTLGSTSTATTTPWCIVHKYSRDICAALVHLFIAHQVIHFGLTLDTIAVTSNKEQPVLTDILEASLKYFATKSVRSSEVLQIVLASKNESRTAPEILNGISSQPLCLDTMLNCEKV